MHILHVSALLYRLLDFFFKSRSIQVFSVVVNMSELPELHVCVCLCVCVCVCVCVCKLYGFFYNSGEKDPVHS